MIKRNIPTVSSPNTTVVVHVRAKFKNGAGSIDKWDKITLNSSYTYNRVAIDFRGQIENFDANSPYNYYIEIFIE